MDKNQNHENHPKSSSNNQQKNDNQKHQENQDPLQSQFSYASSERFSKKHLTSQRKKYLANSIKQAKMDLHQYQIENLGLESKQELSFQSIAESVAESIMSSKGDEDIDPTQLMECEFNWKYYNSVSEYYSPKTLEVDAIQAIIECFRKAERTFEMLNNSTQRANTSILKIFLQSWQRQSGMGEFKHMNAAQVILKAKLDLIYIIKTNLVSPTQLNRCQFAREQEWRLQKRRILNHNNRIRSNKKDAQLQKQQQLQI